MDELAPHARNLIKAHYEKNIDIATLAAQLGREGNAISVTLYRIRQKIRQCIEGKLTVTEST